MKNYLPAILSLPTSLLPSTGLTVGLVSGVRATSRAGLPRLSSLADLQLPVASFSETLDGGDESVSVIESVPMEEGSVSDPSLSLPSNIWATATAIVHYLERYIRVNTIKITPT